VSSEYNDDDGSFDGGAIALEFRCKIVKLIQSPDKNQKQRNYFKIFKIRYKALIVIRTYVKKCNIMYSYFSSME